MILRTQPRKELPVSRKIVILVFEDAILSSTAAPIDIFSRSNEILHANQMPNGFDVVLLAPTPNTVALGPHSLFNCTLGLNDLPPEPAGHKHTLILIPAYAGHWDDVLEKNRAILPWLKAHYHCGTEIASLCTGSYFLAEAGLLDNQECTSHWASVDDLRTRYPSIKVQPDAVVTDNAGIYTGGGAFSSLNLILYLVEKFCGYQIGIQVAKTFSIHRDHINQAHFAIFNGLSGHGDTLILKAQAFIEDNFASNPSVEDVAEKVNMSKRNFIRRFKQAVNQTPTEYMQRVKIEAAKKSLELSQKNIQTVLNDVGYTDTKTFRDTFKRITGITPQEYRRKYAR
ncbi:transcriptional regulator, AraC family [Teredinibacter turnerae T7901]|uniref:Transcriptional regulator, AraC family n=1 Tax=Teredinibacter turnerae (strain ATCC 39867 / T7901) TaxID=377629 RepID=C5BM04_TERTT|nr:helix-turn-helix domain-containing protein [Teredinibacter turnerae]ACR12016.1 transcriptional regulator, AraC family [Teredinibacter turnerae T7901]